jgi:hypothetical protein
VSNSLYKKAGQRLLTGALNLSTATIKAAIVGPTYTPNLTTDEFLTAIASHRIGVDQTLTGVTVANGVFDADNALFPAIAAGSTGYAVVLYVDTGVAGTSPLLYFADQITGFPFNTSGAEVEVKWNDGASKIFSLG